MDDFEHIIISKINKLTEDIKTCKQKTLKDECISGRLAYIDALYEYRKLEKS